MDARLARFVAEHPCAAMITIRPDGSTHVARVEVAVVDGRLASSGKLENVRSTNLRRDPRCTLFVFAAPPDSRWAGLETIARIVDGDRSPDAHLRLMRARHGERPDGTVLAHDAVRGHDRPFAESEYLELVRAEGRLVYEFEIQRAYGKY